ncbi:hypothetical protein AMTRI_Chr02g259880 [Amborella trichopoda]
MFWTPCAAHCVNLMLKEMGTTSLFSGVISRAMFVVGFIYNHTIVLSMMRSFTKKRGLVRPGITRFVTSFLTLRCLAKQKSALRTVFASEQWSQSKWSKHKDGRKAEKIIPNTSFWSQIIIALEVARPLVRVFRLVDGDAKPGMGYIHEAMIRARTEIKDVLKDDENMRKAIFEIIDRRWDTQLHRHLHSAGYFLNPSLHYKHPSIESDRVINGGFLDVLERLVPDKDIQDEFQSHELIKFKLALGNFGRDIATRNRDTTDPGKGQKPKNNLTCLLLYV